MELSFTPVDDILVVSISGAIDRHASGPLYDALVGRVRSGWTKMIVDLSDVDLLARSSVRGLVVAARLLMGAGGELRICGANNSIAALLRGLGFNHLMRCDPTIEASIIALSAGAATTASWPFVLVDAPCLDARGSAGRAMGPEPFTVAVQRRPVAKAG